MCRPLASSLDSNCLSCWHRQQSKAAVWWCWVHHLKLSLAKRPWAHLAWRSMKNRGQVWWLCGEGKKSKWGHFDQTSNFSSKFNFWKGPTMTLFGGSWVHACCLTIFLFMHATILYRLRQYEIRDITSNCVVFNKCILNSMRSKCYYVFKLHRETLRSSGLYEMMITLVRFGILPSSSFSTKIMYFNWLLIELEAPFFHPLYRETSLASQPSTRLWSVLFVEEELEEEMR